MRRSPLLLVALVAVLCSGQASAVATCTVTASGVAFGVYDASVTVPDDSVGTIDVTCTHLGKAGVTDVSYTLRLSTGSSGNYADRRLVSSSRPLAYNLYLDPARSVILGDGSSGTATITGSMRVGPGVGNGTRTVSYSLYGRMPARQDAAVGQYIDTIVASLTF